MSMEAAPAAIEIYEREYLLPRWGDRPSLRGAPMVTARKEMGSRHVPGRSAWGGYDMGRVVEAEKPESVGAQAALF
jgi:hypothetical protein